MAKIKISGVLKLIAALPAFYAAAKPLVKAAIATVKGKPAG